MQCTNYQQSSVNKGWYRWTALVQSIICRAGQRRRPKGYEQLTPGLKEDKTENSQDGMVKYQNEKIEGDAPLPSDAEFRIDPCSEPVMARKSCLQLISEEAIQNGWYIKPNEVEIGQKIGQGTTSDIYQAVWRDQIVAIKWLHPDYFRQNCNYENCIAQEIITLSRQRHQFILPFLGAFISPPEYVWIVTELLDGGTLAEWLYGDKKRRKERLIPLPPLVERIEKGLEISQALEYLHGQSPKIIHRDLKPTNVFLDECMHVRLADFGNARYLPNGETALTGETGTFVYMAPEVIACEPYDEKCDVYSFAILFNELLTGEHPYIETGLKPAQIAVAVHTGRLRPTLPKYDENLNILMDLISQSWNEDASQRPSFTIIVIVITKFLEQLCERDNY